MNPLYQGAENQLEHYDARELTSYFEKIIRDPNVVASITTALGEIDGREWIDLMTMFDEERTLAMLEDDLLVAKKLTGTRLIADARRARVRVEVEEKQKYDDLWRERLQEQLRMKRDQEVRTKEPGSTYYEPDDTLATVKVSELPELPKMEKGAHMLTPMQLERVKVALSTFISPHVKEVAEMSVGLINNYELDITECINGLTAQQRKFEARLGAQLYADAPTCVQDLLLEDDKRTFQGAESFLQMIKSLSTRVNFRSEERTKALLKEYTVDNKPCTNPKALLGMVEEFKIQHGVSARLCSMECGLLYRSAIDHILSGLKDRTDMQSKLTIPLSMVEEQYPGDQQMYMDKLEEKARDLTLWKNTTQPDATPKITFKPTKTGGKGVYAVERTAAEKAEIICMFNREGRPCRDGSKCAYNHDKATGQICTDEEYLKTGICSKFNQGCPHKHPFNTSKHGDKEELIKNTPQYAKKRFLNACNMVEPMDDEQCVPCGNVTMSAEQHLMLHQGAPGEETETHRDLRSGLRLNPEPKRLYKVDQEAIMAVLEGSDVSSIESGDDKSITDTSGEEDDQSFDAEDGIEHDSSDDGWPTSDGTYSQSEDPSSEEVEDDAEQDGQLDEVHQVATQLRDQGWAEDDIASWMRRDKDLSQALERVKFKNSAMAVDADSEPPVKIMFDGGTFDHMWGTELVQAGYVSNIHNVKPVPCRTASGFMWLSQKGDAVLNGVLMKDGFINPNNSTSLASEGKLCLIDGWDFHKNGDGLEFKWGDEAYKSAWRQGVLFYVPAEVMPHRSCMSMEPGLYQDDTVCNMQEHMMQMDATQAQHFWNNECMMVQQVDFQ